MPVFSKNLTVRICADLCCHNGSLPGRAVYSSPLDNGRDQPFLGPGAKLAKTPKGMEN